MPKPVSKALSDLVCRSAKPSANLVRLHDGGGLYLEVTPSGGKHWRLRFAHLGKSNWMALGSYPDLSLASARKAAGEARGLLDRGISPIERRREEQGLQKERAGQTVEKIADEWLKRYGKGWADNTRRNQDRARRYLIERLGKLPIAQVGAPHLWEALQKIEGEHGAVEAIAVRGLAEKIWKFALVTGRAERNIAVDLRGVIVTGESGHYPAITDPIEFGQLLADLETYPGNFALRAYLRLLPLVFVRPDDLKVAKWENVQLSGAEPLWDCWCKKTQSWLKVPLATQAVEILQDLAKHTGHKEFVFTYQRGKPIAPCHKALEAIGYQGKHCPHGFRASFRTIGAEVLGFDPILQEIQLGHKHPGDNLRGAYDRGEYLDRRRGMLQQWADWCDEQKESCKLIGE